MSLIRRRNSSKVLTVSCLAVLALFVLGLGTAGGAEDFSLLAKNNYEGEVYLTWTPVDDPELNAYFIYWDTEEFDSVAGMEAKSAERGTSFIVLDLENGVEYFFAVTAMDSNQTILAQDFDNATPKLPHLKEINYWNLMAVFILTTIIFIYVIIKIPSWGKGKAGGM